MARGLVRSITTIYHLPTTNSITRSRQGVPRTPPFYAMARDKSNGTREELNELKELKTLIKLIIVKTFKRFIQDESNSKRFGISIILNKGQLKINLFQIPNGLEFQSRWIAGNARKLQLPTRARAAVPPREAVLAVMQKKQTPCKRLAGGGEDSGSLFGALMNCPDDGPIYYIQLTFRR